MESLLSDLNAYCQDFIAALALFDSCDQLRKAYPAARGAISLWPFIAARDGGMTIYHFGKVLDALRASLKGAPELRSATNHDALRDAAKSFTAAFPLYAKMRHAIAHAGDMRVPASEKRNAIVGDIDLGSIKLHNEDNSGTSTISNTLMGRTFGNTFEGEYVTYSISSESLQSLQDVKGLTYSAFLKITEPDW